MTDVSIPELMFTTISLVFLLLGVVLIASIVMSTINPNEQIAFANVEKLRAAMDQACSTGQDVRINFELPQNTPVATGMFQVMPIWLIRTNGDPNYVIYYESFPPGEAVGWEAYQVMQNRLIVPLPEGWVGKTKDEVDEYVKTIYTQWQNNNAGQKLEGVIVNNVELGSERFDYYLGESSENREGGNFEDRTTDAVKNYGTWQRTAEGSTVPLEGDNYFKFNNYAGLNDFEKSAIKYATCGANYMCLKTRTGVYRMKLNQCNDVKAVQLIYNAKGEFGWQDALAVTDDVALSAALTKSALKNILTLPWKRITGATLFLLDGATLLVKAHVSFKISDFNVVSPCKLDASTGSDMGLTIKKMPCEYSTTDFPWGSGAVNYKVCENVMKYPMYRYNKDTEKLELLEKFHYSCVESIGESLQALPNEEDGDYTNGQCVQFEMTKYKQDYCWTPNPYKKDPDSGFWGFFDIDIIRESFMWFFDPPVKSNSVYFQSLDGKAIVLNPTDVALGRGQKFLEALDRKWWWGWP